MPEIIGMTGIGVVFAAVAGLFLCQKINEMNGWEYQRPRWVRRMHIAILLLLATAGGALGLHVGILVVRSSEAAQKEFMDSLTTEVVLLEEIESSAGLRLLKTPEHPERLVVSYYRIPLDVTLEVGRRYEVKRFGSEIHFISNVPENTTFK